MTGKTDPIRKQASKEATDWLILLKDDPDDAGLRRAFEAWRRKSAVNAAAWDAMQQASDAMDKATPVHADRWQPSLADLRGETHGDGTDGAEPALPSNGRRTMRPAQRKPERYAFRTTAP